MAKGDKQEKKVRERSPAPEFSPGETAYLSAQISQCGKRGYLDGNDARRIGAQACAACGLYHVGPEQVAA